MDLKSEYIINRINIALNAKYEKDPDFSKQRKDWAFFVSVPMFIELKRDASDYIGLPMPIVLMEQVELEVLGCKVFASDGLKNNDIYFAKKLQIKEDN